MVNLLQITDTKLLILMVAPAAFLLSGGLATSRTGMTGNAASCQDASDPLVQRRRARFDPTPAAI
jgi:hypothetical protein